MFNQVSHLTDESLSEELRQLSLALDRERALRTDAEAALERHLETHRKFVEEVQERQRVHDAAAIDSLARIRELTMECREERESREATQRAALRVARKASAQYRKYRTDLERVQTEQNEARQPERERAALLALELAKTAQLVAAQTRVEELEHSLSWRMTAPVRKAANLLHWNGRG